MSTNVLHPEGFKARMVARMAGPEGISACALAREVGVPQPTLSRWLRSARSVRAMSHPEQPSKRPQSSSSQEKLRIVVEAARLKPEELGAFLRREGLHEAQLLEWTRAATSGLDDPRPPERTKKVKNAEQRRIRELERELRRKDAALAEVAALLALQKNPRPVGGRGRWHGHEERDVTLGLIVEAMSAGARQAKACEPFGLSARTLERWRKQSVGAGRRAGPLSTPRNKLSAAEEAHVIELVNRPEFRDLSPRQIVPILAERGEYVASESKVYRLLHEAKQQRHRQSSRPPSQRYAPKELVATATNKVWSWDITWMPSIIRGMYFRAYLVLDVWSRKIVAAEVYEHKSAEHSAALVAQACERCGVEPGQLSLHSDNGGPIKGATMLATLQSLDVVSSSRRPGVSNDNPNSEALFRTLKYRPDDPERPFATLEGARAWLRDFVRWSNTCRRHSAIGDVTPDERHDARDADILKRRKRTYAAAWRRHPQRWSRSARPWTTLATVTLNPVADRKKQPASA